MTALFPTIKKHLIKNSLLILLTLGFSSIVNAQCPSVEAGPNASICTGDTFTTSDANSSNNNGVLWTTSGTGTFTNATHTTQATYTPSAADIANGSVILTITATPNPSCSTGLTYESSLTLTIVSPTTVSAMADFTACSNETPTVQATITNAASITWSSSNGGSFINPNAATTTYLPSSAEIAAGVAHLTVTVSSSTPCSGNVSDNLTITIEPAPTANAGNDESIEHDATITINTSSASNYNNLIWTTTGDGSFNDINILNPTYTPGANDISNGSVVLTLSATPNSPCSSNTTDDMTLTIVGAPSVDAGTNFSMCENDSPTLNGSAQSYASVLWTSSGDGNFSDPNILNPMYFPGPNEIAAGVAHLTLTNNFVYPYTGSSSDNLTITIQSLATVEAGPNVQTCGIQTISLSGSATNYDAATIQWSTSGTGTFSATNILNPSYTPSNDDLLNGGVTLTLEVLGQSPCAEIATDNLVYTIRSEVEVNAGVDETICQGPHNLNATITNASTINWTTSGDGTFLSSSIEDPIYVPGPTDVTNGSVVLTVTAQSIAPCTGFDIDNLILYIVPAPSVSAGPDATVCASSPAYIITNSSITNSTNFQWFTSGTGTFNDDTELHPTYTPSAADIASGSVTLRIQSENAPCTTVYDDMVLTIQGEPTVDAGNNEVVCTGYNVTITTASASNATVNWTTTNGTGSFVNASAINPTYVPSSADYALSSLILQMEGTAISPCGGSVTDQVTITFADSPTANAGSNALICEDETHTLNTATATNYAALSWASNGDGTWDDPSILHPTYTPGTSDILSGSVSLTLTAQPLSGCSVPSTSSITLTIQPNPSINAGNDESVCAGNSISINSASASDYQTIAWTTSGSGTFSNSSIIDPVYTPSAADISNGTVQLTLTGTSISPCGTSVQDHMILTVVPNPTAYAGADAVSCENGSYLIADATASNYSNIIWTTSGTGTFSDVNNLNPTYTPSLNDRSNGSVTLQITAVGINPCSSSATDQMEIVFDPLPVVNAGDDASVCSGFSHSINSASVTNSTSITWTTSGDGTFSNPNLVSTIYTPGVNDRANGSVILTLTADGLGLCSGSVSDQLILTIISNPTATAGPDETICETAFTLTNASATNYSTVQWSTSGSSGTLSNATTLTPTYTASAADIAQGYVILTLTVNPISPCASPVSDNIRLTIRELAEVNAGPDAQICENQTYTISGANVSNTSSYGWTSSGTGTFTNASTLTPTYTPSASDITNGSVRLTLTAASNTPCTQSVSDEMEITFEPLPVVDAGPNTTICQNSTYTASTASVQYYSSVLWTSSGTGTFDNSSTINTTYTPSSADILNGSVRLFLTAQSNAPCTNSVSDYIDITINSLPTANAGPNVPSLCSGDSYTVSGASATNYSSINWTTSGSGQIINPNSLSPTYIPSIGDAALGTVTLTLEAAGLSPCSTSATDAMIINVIPGATISGGSSGDVCINSTYTVTDVTVTNYASLSWTHSGYGNIINSGTDSPTYYPAPEDLALGIVTLRLTVEPNSPCSDIQYLDYDLTIYSEPSVNAGSDNTICEGDNYALSDATASDYTSLLWTTSGTGTFSNQNALNPTYIPTSNDVAAGSVVLTLTAYGQAACSTSPSDEMILTFIEIPKVNAGNNGSVCENGSFTVTTATASDYNTLSWTHNGSGTLANAGTLNPTYTPGATDVSAGTITLTLTAEGDARCTNATDQMEISVIANPVVNAGPDQVTCERDAYNIVHASVQNSSSYVWSTSGSGTFTNASIINPTYTPSSSDVASGAVLLTLTASPNLPCASTVYDSFILQFEDAPTANAGPDASICQGSAYTIPSASATNYTTISWSSSGNGTFVNENTLSPTYTPSQNDILLGSVTLTMQAHGNSPCNSITDDMVLNITVMPVVDAGVDAEICTGSNYPVVTASVANTSNIYWTTSGTGTFINGNNINPVYTPSADDISAGSVILTLTASADSPCAGQVSDFMTLTIVNESTAYAGPDATICAGNSYQINNAIAQNYSSLSWASSGWGTFINNGTISPTYFPSASDLAAGSVVITLTAHSTVPCTADATDSFVLFFNDGPLVDAGNPTSICEDGIYTNTDASASNTTSVFWTSSGTGTFTNATILNTTYIPSAQDIINGAVTLTLTGNGVSPCTTDSDYVTITINHKPTASAGPTTDICTGSNIIQGASASSYSSLLWTSSGSGTLDNATTLTPTYTPNAADITNGTVTLTLTAYPLSPCALPATSSILLNVHQAPTVNAGADDIICENGSYTLSGASAGNTSSVLWTSSGTGTFSDPNVVNTTYTPSYDDALNGNITLTITGSNLSCSNASDYMILTVQRMPQVYAGKDSAVCETGVYVVQDADIRNYTSIQWTHNGTGTLASATTLSPIYTPGPGDLSAGTVTLSVAVTAANPCSGIINDALILEVKHEPTAYAGPDTTICSTANYLVNGATASDFESVTWSSSGSGIFLNQATLSPTYIPSQADINNGNVILRLHASNPPCNNVTDQMTLTFRLSPQVDAGFDASVNFGSAFQITSATASNHNGLAWTSNGTGTFSDPGILLPTYTPSAQDFSVGQVTLTLTATGISPCSQVSDQMTLTVTDQPNVEFTWGNECSGSTTQFSIDQSITDVGTIVSWNWDFGDGFTSSLMEPTHTYNVAGTYHVTLTVVDVNSYTSTISHDITIHRLPLVNFDIDSPSCSSLETQFNDYSTATDGYITQWYYSFGDGNSETILFPDNPNITHTYAHAGVYNVILTVTNSLGCINSMARSITVVPSPMANFDMNAVCITGGANFVDLSQTNGGSSIVEWSWDFGDPNSGLNNISSSQHPTHIYSVDGNYSVTLEITNTNGCRNSITQDFDVSIQPDVDFSFNGNGCLNNETQFTLISDDLNISNINLIEWNFGDGTPLSSELNPVHTYTATGTYLVTLTINNNGCESIITKTVTIYPSPIADFSFANTCMGNPTNFTDLSNNTGSPITTWNWEFGVVTRTDDVSSLQNPNYTYEESGSYTASLTVTDANGCINTHTEEVQILPTPYSAFTYNENYENTQGRLLFSNESSGATSYMWDFGDGGSSIETDPIHSFLSDGIYTIELISFNDVNCSDTISQQYRVLFKGLFIPSAFSPNSPQVEVRTFKAVGINLSSFIIEVFDGWGNKVWESTALDDLGRPSESWDGTFRGQVLPAGVYVWKASAVFMDGSSWEGKDMGNNEGSSGKTYGTVTIIR